MQYMFLIYEDESQRRNATVADQQAMFGAYEALTKSMQKAGVMKDGNALQPSTNATTVRVRSAKPQTSDGPAINAVREQLAGYYLLDCKNLDEALSWAAKIPSAAYGAVEVRPVMEHG